MKNQIFDVSNFGSESIDAVTNWRRVLWFCLTVVVFWAQAALAQEVTLNLKDADIKALIGTVSEITGTNFIVDPRVKGKVTVISAQPMSGEEIYEVFLSVLKVHGFSAVPSGAVVKIVPDVNAKQDSIPIIGDRSSKHGDQMVTRVIQVNNVPAAQLVPVLRPLVPQQGHLAAYASTNVLIISDRARNIRRLVSIIERIDQKSEGEIELIPLQYASAAEVVRVLTAVTRSSASGVVKGKGIAARTGGGGPVLIADERTNSVLLGGNRGTRLRLRTIISHLDTPLDSGGNTHVVYLKYAQATELIQVLQGVGTTQSKEKKAEGAPVRTEFDIQADEATNALVITAPPDVFRSLKAVIDKLDIRRAQVLVEAIIAEVSSDKARELGVQWVVEGLSGGGTAPIGIINFTNVGTSVAEVVGAISSQTLPSVTGGVSIGGGRVGSDGTNFIGLLKLLSNDANTNILSTPTLITMDNEEAEIVVGENVPFVTGSFTNTGSSNAATNPFQTIERQDVGLTLKIKPQISEGDVVKLEVEQEVSSISSSAEAVDIITNKRAIKTTVLVGDGEVVVLGGLIEDRHRVSKQKVPFLGDLPLLGRLFRAENSTKEKTNLMVFIQPIILRDDATANRYSAERYDYIRAQQIYLQQQGVPLMREEVVPLIPDFNHGATSVSPAGSSATQVQ